MPLTVPKLKTYSVSLCLNFELRNNFIGFNFSDWNPQVPPKVNVETNRHRWSKSSRQGAGTRAQMMIMNFSEFFSDIQRLVSSIELSKFCKLLWTFNKTFRGTCKFVESNYVEKVSDERYSLIFNLFLCCQCITTLKM